MGRMAPVHIIPTKSCCSFSLFGFNWVLCPCMPWYSHWSMHYYPTNRMPWYWAQSLQWPVRCTGLENELTGFDDSILLPSPPCTPSTAQRQRLAPPISSSLHAGQSLVGYKQRQKQWERSRHRVLWSGWTYKHKSTNCTKTNGAGRRYILLSSVAVYWRRACIFKSCILVILCITYILLFRLFTTSDMCMLCCVDEIRSTGYSVRRYACTQACYMDWCWAFDARPSCAAWWYVCSGQRRRSPIIRAHHANAVQGMHSRKQGQESHQRAKWAWCCNASHSVVF